MPLLLAAAGRPSSSPVALSRATTRNRTPAHRKSLTGKDLLAGDAVRKPQSRERGAAPSREAEPSGRPPRMCAAAPGREKAWVRD
ncbi:Hypothetical predicted protein [Marmota monax]|uniref:Uncharacterized protein n=1 Tax=Marmota monax TaxID=9995 RepID=A0A5E4ADY1_MARMO|nr:hypothetical protein GHT09_001483 [Marmota monax]VTJ55464.1 Hypothetical predicted protein [Marmota monax]